MCIDPRQRKKNKRKNCKYSWTIGHYESKDGAVELITIFKSSVQRDNSKTQNSKLYRITHVEKEKEKKKKKLEIFMD